MPKLLIFLKEKKTIVLYTLYFIGVFVISLYITFPLDTLKPLIEGKLRVLFNRPVSFTRIDTHYITGVELDDLVIADTKGGTEPLFSAQKVTLFMNPFSLLGGSYSGYFNVESLGGKISGSLSMSNTEIDIDTHFKGINPKLLKLLVAKDYVIDGKINGSIEGIAVLNDFTKSNGRVELDAKKLNIEHVSLTTPLGPFVFPELEFTNFITSISIKDGNVDLKKITLEGESAKIYIKDGIIKLAKNRADAKINLKLEFELDEELKKRFGVIVDQFCNYNSATNLYSLKLSGSLLAPVATK